MLTRFLHRSSFIAAALFVVLLMTTGALGQECARVAGLPPPNNRTCTVTANETLSANFNGNIVIARDGVTLDCKGVGVIRHPDDPMAHPGIDLTGRSNVTIQNCLVTDHSMAGVLLLRSQGNTLQGNFAGNNDGGFRLSASSNNKFFSNTATRNRRDGFELDAGSNGNTFGGTPASLGNRATQNRVNGFELDYSNNNKFLNNRANSNRNNGFSIDGSRGNEFTDNRATGNGRNGFRISVGEDEKTPSTDNTFTRNIANGREAGPANDPLADVLLGAVETRRNTMAGGMNRFDGNRFGFLVPFEAERWRFKQVGRGEVPDFFTEAEPPDFSSGRAAFGSRSGICSVQAMVHTDWDLNTDMLLRRTIPLPPDASIVQVFIGIDNDFMAFWNGTEMRREEHEGCPAPPDFVIQVPDTVLASRLGKASDLFAIRAIDRGGESFVDVSISWVSNRPAPQP